MAKKLKIEGKVPKILIDACLKSGNVVSIINEGPVDESLNAYYLFLKEGLVNGLTGNRYIFGNTVKRCLNRISHITTKDKYKKVHGK